MVINKKTVSKNGPSSLTIKKKKKREKPKAPNPDDEDVYKDPIKRIIKPDNQLELSEEELKSEVTRVLTGDDPNVPKNITKYSFKDQCYKLDPPGLSDLMSVHLSMDGCSLHIESEEYREQKDREIRLKSIAEEEMKLWEQSSAFDGEDDETSLVATIDKNKNQFNFSDRATQTINNKLSSRFVCTEPPPVAPYSANVTQWQIYDCYMKELQVVSIDVHETSSDKKKTASTSDNHVVPSDLDEIDDPMNDEAILTSLKIIERLVNQNAQDEVYNDFKYWEDASDQYRQGEGTLLPLWRFAYERTKMKQVTSLCWNPRHNDLFAVGYGSYDFLNQGAGMICCYSMKNASFPEYSFVTESGIMCLDFHPQHPSLLVAGCYDGNVAVFNISNNDPNPIYLSSIKTGNHSDPVWQVNWQEQEDSSKELSFYSISSDGKVMIWELSKNELIMETVMLLKLTTNVNDDPEEATITALAGGCCFDFNKKLSHLFLVGTEEGRIHKCSKAYSGQYLQTYESHHVAVYSVKWNPFHERIFISCSADWNVKLWDHVLNYPLMSFDLGNPVGDVHWSPYSSTVFSAITNDGKVVVFDLHQNKLHPLCEQKIVKRARLTHIRFSTQDFILIVGDDRGGVNSFKLSPNLRNLSFLDKEQVESLSDADLLKVQESNMEKLLQELDVKSMNSL